MVPALAVLGLLGAAGAAAAPAFPARHARQLDTQCFAKVFEFGEECWDVTCTFFTEEAGGDTTCREDGDTLCCADDKDDCCVPDATVIGVFCAGGVVFLLILVLACCACCGACPLYGHLCCAPDRGCCVPGAPDVERGLKVHESDLGMLVMDGAMSGASAVNEKAVLTPPASPAPEVRGVDAPGDPEPSRTRRRRPATTRRRRRRPTCRPSRACSAASRTATANSTCPAELPSLRPGARPACPLLPS